ncbi:MAG: BREX system P-loop protein BrxC [Chloroflexales bacterium]
MQIIETFATHISVRIEPVVKVADRDPERMLDELRNLIVTPQWEQHVRQVLDGWAEAANGRAGGDPGIWISGFFGSGKSLLMKVLGLILEGGDLAGQSVHELFLSRLPAGSRDRSEIQRLLTIIRRTTTTSAIGSNIHALEGSSADSLALITFKLFAFQRGYTRNWALAWGVEYYLDQAGQQEAFHRRAEELSGKRWDRLQRDTAYYIDTLMQAAADVLPDHFADGRAAVQRTVTAATQAGMTPSDVIERMVSWCRLRDADGRRHRVLLQLDEIGQWMASGDSNQRGQQVQALIETAAIVGEGRVWIAVTAHGDIQALQASVQQEQYAKINQRFSQKIKLSNDDMSHVVEARLLQKNPAGRAELAARFTARTGHIADLGSLKGTARVYPVPTDDLFPTCYPYLPWMIDVVPDMVKGIAQAAGRGDALTGATRTMISVIQGAILDTPDLLHTPVGRLLNLVDLYPQLVADVSVETKTDINSIPHKVPDATPLTADVAVALYLLGQATHIPCIPENLARALVTSLDEHLTALAARIRPELDRLIDAGYAKQVGETYAFLSTQQRSFQDKVRESQHELRLATPVLSQALRDVESDDMFQLAQLQGQGRQIKIKLLMDGRPLQSGPSRVAVHILSPIQRSLDPGIADDEVMRQRANQEPETFFLRMDEVKPLRDALSLYVATKEIADRIIAANPAGSDAEVARQAKTHDLSGHLTAVRGHLRTAMRGAQIFFRGSSYYPSSGSGDAVRSMMTQLLPLIYSRLSEVPHRVASVETAVRAALNGTYTNMDIQLLHVVNGDGSLNPSSPLLSAVRGSVPPEHADRPPVDAVEIRRIFEDPPYGWDGGAVTVAMALLLRAGLAKLIVEGRIITDPQDPDATLALTRDQRFRHMRLLGVRAELDSPQLIAARGFYETLFGSRPALVPATLNNALGERLGEITIRGAAIQQWASAASFPLPVEFSSGLSVVTEVSASPTPVARLPLFGDRHPQILDLLALLEQLEQFRQRYGSDFPRVRDYYTSMINASLNVPELQTFLRTFSTLASERRCYDPPRWVELVRAREAAEAAVTAQMARWTDEARRRATTAIARIPDLLGAIGVVAEQTEEYTPYLCQPFDLLLAELPDLPSVSVGSQLGTQLDMLDLNLSRKLERIRTQRMPQPPINDAGPGTATIGTGGNDTGPGTATIGTGGNDTGPGTATIGTGGNDGAGTATIGTGGNDHTQPQVILRDAREVIRDAIRARQGQPEFRDRLLVIFGNQCLVTGCRATEALEAAHIDPYCVSQNHDPANGLILRADIHTLFDLGLLAIDTERRCVVFRDNVQDSYTDLRTCDLTFPDDAGSAARLHALDTHRRNCGL